MFYSYCNRCCRQFNNLSAYAQHTRDSSHHHECAKCVFDAESWDDLCDHTREDGCGIVCQGGDGGLGEIWEAGSRKYWQHVHEQNVCTICERHFDNSTNLQQVPSPTNRGCFSSHSDISKASNLSPREKHRVLSLLPDIQNLWRHGE